MAALVSTVNNRSCAIDSHEVDARIAAMTAITGCTAGVKNRLPLSPMAMDFDLVLQIPLWKPDSRSIWQR